MPIAASARANNANNSQSNGIELLRRDRTRQALLHSPRIVDRFFRRDLAQCLAHCRDQRAQTRVTVDCEKGPWRRTALILREVNFASSGSRQIVMPHVPDHADYFKMLAIDRQMLT